MGEHDDAASASDDGAGLTRRQFLRAGGAVAVAVFVPFGRDAAEGSRSVAVALSSDLPSFLSPGELRTLRALVDRFIPGPPEDTEPGAVEAGCAEAIDALLAAFDVDPPFIYAGAPFSDRAGSPVNHFEQFLRLDPYEELGWRLRIAGSRDRPDLEFNGPVKGYQQIYRDGIAALDAASGSVPFADLPGPVRDVILRTSNDDAIDDVVDVGFTHTWELMYGAPEYGGNRDLVGWRYTRYDGDVHPRGWTREEIEEPDSPEILPGVPMPASIEDLVALAPLAAPDAGFSFSVASGRTLAGMQAQIDAILKQARGRTDG